MTTDAAATFGFEEDFQSALVSACLQDPTFLKQYEGVLLPAYFDYDYLASVLRILREVSEKIGYLPSKMSFIEEAKSHCVRFSISDADREVFLKRIESLYTMRVVDLDYMGSRVVEFGRRQKLRSAILKIAGMYGDAKNNGSEFYDKAEHILDEALRTGFDSTSLGLSLYPMLEKMPSVVAASSSGVSKKVPTLFDTLDKHTMGGPSRGEVWTVIGYPGRGKSALLMNLGVAALKSGFPVFHYTIGDLNEIDVGVRYAARLTMSTTMEVVTGSDSYMKKASSLSKYNPHLHIKYWPSETATMGHIRAHASRLRAIEGVSPGLVIIDYPEELRMPVEENLYLSGGSTYSACNKMAAEFDALVWTASQPKTINPKDWARRPFLVGQDAAESSKKHHKADGIITWNMSYEEELAHRARIWVDKTRRARSHYMVYMDVDLERMVIREGKPPKDLEKPESP